MRPTWTIIFFVCISVQCKSQDFDKSHNWRIYDAGGPDAFLYPLDTIMKFPDYALNDDSIGFFLSHIQRIVKEHTPVWMGSPHLATYQMADSTYTIYISHYAGFFFDTRTKKYFQIAKEDIDDWHTYIRECFISLRNRKQRQK